MASRGLLALYFQHVSRWSALSAAPATTMPREVKRNAALLVGAVAAAGMLGMRSTMPAAPAGR